MTRVDRGKLVDVLQRRGMCEKILRVLQEVYEVCAGGLGD